jgi:hypothetical protein
VAGRQTNWAQEKVSEKVDLMPILFFLRFVVVSPEYNATVCPTLTNLMNYFPPAAYRHKPASIATYSMGEFNVFVNG